MDTTYLATHQAAQTPVSLQELGASPSAEPEKQAAVGADPAAKSQTPVDGLTAAAHAVSSATADAVHISPTAEGADPAAKRARKFEKPETARDSSWSLKRKLAALTHDVELLSQEVARVRTEADMSSAAPELTAPEKAMLAEKHAKKLAETLKRGISVMLRDIMQHKWAFPFNKPVDVNLYKDYLTRIRNPMDFGTIKGRLDAGFYTFNSDGFAADMRQVFENAFTYNAAGSDVHSMAMTLKDKFEERMKGLASRMAGVDNERSREEEELRELARRRLQAVALEGLGVHRTRLDSAFSALDARIREAKSEAAKSCGFVTLAEKQALVDALSELKAEDFEFAIQLVVNRHPGLLQPNSEEMDIDLEPLDSLTLRQLAAFARCCLRGRSPEAPTCWPGLLFGSGVPGFMPSEAKRLRPFPPLDQSLAVPSSAPAASPAEAGVPPPPNTAAQSPDPSTARVVATPAKAKSATAAPTAGPNQSGGLIYQTRSIGERSWSVLDRAAHHHLHRQLVEAPGTQPPDADRGGKMLPIPEDGQARPDAPLPPAPPMQQ